MPSIGIRELKQRASQVLRHVREEGVSYDVTYHGRPVARLVPLAKPETEPVDAEAVWSDLDQLAAEIGARWPDGLSAAEAVDRDRRGT